MSKFSLKNIFVFIGTRPEAIKLAPLILKLRENKFFDVTVCLTGQHKDMVHDVLKIFGIKWDYDFDIMVPNQSLSNISGKLLQRLGTFFQGKNPNMVLVQGDTLTTMVVSLSAYYNKIQIGYVEAGLRTFDLYSPWPEEGHRLMVSRISEILFAPSYKEKDYLKNENIDQNKIYVTGNTAVDALFFVKEKISKNPNYYAEFFPERVFKNPLVLITGHSRENFGVSFVNVCESIKWLSTKYQNYNFIYPVHLNPNVKGPVNTILKASKQKNIILIDPLPYDLMVSLMLKSKIIITDSGGIQEEAPSLGIPTFITRNKTERMEGIRAGISKLVGTDKEIIIKEVSKILDNNAEYKKMSKKINLYGDGKASEKIVHQLAKKIKN